MRVFRLCLVFTLTLVVILTTLNVSEPPDSSPSRQVVRIGTYDPSLEEVGVAVRDYFARGDVGVQAEDAVRTWSEAAVPHLRTLVSEGLNQSLHFEWICCVKGMDSPSNVELLVDVLQGETAVSPSRALDSTMVLMQNHYWRSRFLEHKEFKPAAFAFAQDSNWRLRGVFAKLAGSMGWEDAIPEIEVMLDDLNQSLRGDAADALTILTGEPVFAKLTPSSFPARQLAAGLVGKPERVQEVGNGHASLIVDFEGGSHLCLFDDRSMYLRNAEGAPQRRLSIQGQGIEAISLPADGAVPALLVVATRSAPGRIDSLVAVNSNGEEQWTHPCSTGIGCITALRTLEGVDCVAFSADRRLSFLARDGKLIGELERLFTARELLSHPAFPGELYEVFRIVYRIQVSSSTVKSLGNLHMTGIVYTRGVLFPDSNGARAFLLGGRGNNSTPTLQRIDSDGELIWSATLKGYISDMTIVERPEHPPIFVITDRSGTLTILDAKGALLAEAEIPTPSGGRDKFLYDLEAGELAPDDWGIYVRTLKDTFIFPLDLEALR